MGEALWAELLKVRRSRLPWVTAGAFTVCAAVGGMFMYILLDPGRARSLGLIGAKTQLSGATADWAGYFGLLAQTVAVGGVLLYGLIVVWLFGREFSDHTAKDLLALPTSRTAVVLAKFAVAAMWSAALAVQIGVLGLAIGALLDLPGWSPATAAAGLAKILVTAALTVTLTTVFAYAASAGRGYLAAVGTMIAVLFCAQVVAALGYGRTFPLSVPGVYAGLGGTDQQAPGPIGFALVLLVGAAGLVATVTWWRRADHIA
ncbi:ABC transporter permease [Streptosporangiaceae bacterium NEAU-GS5]|nr:ABC transporter permease [Streptosporangiaceae bacterium NEAU-GS5]